MDRIEHLLETWRVRDEERSRLVEAINRIETTRAHMAATYGMMPDSAELIREDRER